MEGRNNLAAAASVEKLYHAFGRPKQLDLSGATSVDRGAVFIEEAEIDRGLSARLKAVQFDCAKLLQQVLSSSDLGQASALSKRCRLLCFISSLMIMIDRTRQTSSCLLASCFLLEIKSLSSLNLSKLVVTENKRSRDLVHTLAGHHARIQSQKCPFCSNKTIDSIKSNRPTFVSNSN